MRYPAPVTPNPSKEMEDLVDQIRRYHKGALEIKTRLSKLKSAHRRVSDSIRRHEILSETSKKDARQAMEKLSDIKQLTHDFESQLQSQGKAFKNDMVALDDLKQGIRTQTEEVWGKTSALQNTCQDWRFANQLNSDVCSSTRSHAFGAFYRWSLIQPLLKIWMATDSQIHRTTYASAQYEGVYEELMAHLEVKDAIEQFGEDHYAVYRETEDLVHTVKQVQEERQLRSDLLDQVHVTAARKLARMVSSCRALQKDIEQREALRFKMNGLMMELSNALDVDLRTALDTCEVEATKPSSITVADLQRAIQEGTLVEAAGAKDTFSPTEDDNLRLGSPMRVSESAAKGRAETSPRNRIGHSTEANTKLNAVSKLPLLVNPDTRHSSTEYSTSTGDTGPETSTHRTKPSLHDSIYAALPQYDNSAITYVQSFDAPKRTKTWKWCKLSAPDVNKSVQTLFPTVRGPVGLVAGAPKEDDVPSVPRTDSPKTPSIPTFRRRVGHSSRNPLAGRVISNVNLFSRERVSVGSSGLPPEYLGNQDGVGAAAQEGAAGSSIAGRAGIIGARSGSPTESAEEQRKRALKFMLNSRETHYDLMERNVVDAVTLMQMEQARAAAAVRRQNERLATASGLLMEGTGDQVLSERDTHQYRTHQLLTEDYTGRVGGDSGLNSASEEYSMYVALPDMAALTSLTARQAVRTMQSASASITYDTVSKISEILEEATSMAKQQSRAGTADAPQRVVYGYGGYGASPTPPHSPGRQQQGQQLHMRRDFSTPIPAGSAQASSVPSLLESSLEAQTTTVLESIPIETQAQDLNERVAVDFRRAREQVEDWIETHTQCHYKATKRSLLELISNLELDLKVPAEGDRDTGNRYLSEDDSSVEGVGQALPDRNGAERSASAERPLSASAFTTGAGSVNTTLQGMLDMSKSLIGSIQQNLREFAEKTETSLIPDDISEHRRPNSAGILSGHRSRSAAEGAVGGGYYDEDEDESGFNVCDYAFTSRPGSAMQQQQEEAGENATETGSPSPKARSAAATKKLHAHLLGQGTGGWPTRRTLLTSMESIICGQLFVVDFYWLPQKTSTEIIAKSFVNKNEYHQCQIAVTPHMISDLTNTPRDLALHTLFHDPTKVTQAIIASLTHETLDDCFYADIVKAYRHARVQAGGEFSPQWGLLVVEDMLHPRNIPLRRGSISQLYRPSSAPNTPDTRLSVSSKHLMTPDLLQPIQSGKREYEFLMHILTVRKKSGELLAYSFPSVHSITTATDQNTTATTATTTK